MQNQFNINHLGTELIQADGNILRRSFKFTTDDIGKYLVLKVRYEEHLFWGSPMGTRLQINSQNPDEIYGVYKIDYYTNHHRDTNDISYKIRLEPVGCWGAWCPNRAWYTSDAESHVNNIYNLFREYPVFNTVEDATKFALRKNNELYPDQRSLVKKFFDYIFNN